MTTPTQTSSSQARKGLITKEPFPEPIGRQLEHATEGHAAIVAAIVAHARQRQEEYDKIRQLDSGHPV